MVALHALPIDDQPLDAEITDDDLVIALDAGAELVPSAVDALLNAASHLPADAWFGDIRLHDGREVRRPAWSPTRVIGEPNASSPMAVRAGWLRSHSLRPGDPALPLALAAAHATVAHLPTVLTHHDLPLSGPTRDEIDRHLRVIGVPATVRPNGDRFVLAPDAGFAPAVSVVIPTAGATMEVDGSIEMAFSRLLASLGPLPDRIELIAVVGDEYQGDVASLEGSVEQPVSLLRRPPGQFNFAAAINLGVLNAHHDLVLMLNDDTEADGTEFIDRLAVHLADPTVAAVGARLLYPDGTVQHTGVIIDDARPLHPFVGWDPDDTARFGGNIARDVIAVTGGCLMARRSDLLAVGGLSTGFPLSFNDMDLCVRLRRAVGRIVIEPAATLVHHETLTRGPEINAWEWDRWISRWGEIVDPWYHPGHHRPDDPHELHRNADHLDPDLSAGRPSTAAAMPAPRTGMPRSRVHRGRPATTPR